MKNRTIDDVISKLQSPGLEQLPTPKYEHRERRPMIALALKSFNRHMTDEGHQLQMGWGANGIQLYGRHYRGHRIRDARDIASEVDPSLCIVQDKREWDPSMPGCFDKHSAFFHIDHLRSHAGIFRMTVCKDSHHRPPWTRNFHDEIGCHAWFVYYHPRIVCHLASWIRPQHCIRIYHTVCPRAVPAFSASGRSGTLLSGATMSEVYPLRSRLAIAHRLSSVNIQGIDRFRHPGYHAKGSHTPKFLADLSKFKVSICTTSIYGYALRKIIESVACGCVAVTDLPVDDVLPKIDEALVRIPHESEPKEVFDLCRDLESKYDADRAEHFAKIAVKYYNWRASGERQIKQACHMMAVYQ